MSRGNRGGTHGQPWAYGQAGNLDSSHLEMSGTDFGRLRLWYRGTEDMSQSSCGQSQLTHKSGGRMERAVFCGICQALAQFHCRAFMNME